MLEFPKGRVYVYLVTDEGVDPTDVITFTGKIEIEEGGVTLYEGFNRTFFPMHRVVEVMDLTE